MTRETRGNDGVERTHGRMSTEYGSCRERPHARYECPVDAPDHRRVRKRLRWEAVQPCGECDEPPRAGRTSSSVRTSSSGPPGSPSEDLEELRAILQSQVAVLSTFDPAG